MATVPIRLFVLHSHGSRRRIGVTPRTDRDSRRRRLPPRLGTGREYPIDGPSNALIVYDVDGDRNVDIVSIDWSGTTLMKGNGQGEFSRSTASPAIAMPPYSYSAAIGDLNGDGWPDLVITNESSCTLNVMFGKCR